MERLLIPENIQQVLYDIFIAYLDVEPEEHELTLRSIEELGGMNELYDEILKSAGCLLRVLIEAEEKQFLNKGLLASEEN